MLPPDKSDAVAWATYTSRQQSLRSLQSTQSLPKLRTLSEAEKTDLVRIIVPSLTPFTLHAKQSIGYILGIRKEKHAHVSSVWRKLSKRGRTIAYLLTASLLFFPQIVFTLSLDESHGFAWVGITALAPVAYLALFMNVRVLGLTFSQFEARFLGINALAWTVLLYYGVHDTSVRVGALSMLADALLLMFWDALPQFFRHERTLSLVLPISAMFIWQSFVAFFHGIRLDETSLRFVGIDFRIPARLSAFAATTGIYGLGHVERWLSTKNDDFSTIRVPAKSIKIPEQALEELSHCLHEVRLRARKRSGSLFSRKLRRGSQTAPVTPGSVLQKAYSNDLIRAASSASSSEGSRGAESSPFTVLAARAPLQISTSDTIVAYWFGPRIGDAVFEWNKRLGYFFFLIFQVGHILVLWCMQPGGAWAWWLLYVMTGLPTLAWLCIMNRFVLRMVVKSFEFKFMLLNIAGFCVTVAMAMQDKRAAAAMVAYLLSTGLGSVMDAFPRAMLTFKVRIMLGIPNLATLSILVYQISAGILHPFKSQQACLTKGACITQADLASGFGINMIAFLFRVGFILLRSPSSFGSVSMEVSILRVPEGLMTHYLALHHRYLEPDKVSSSVCEADPSEVKVTDATSAPCVVSSS